MKYQSTLKDQKKVAMKANYEICFKTEIKEQDKWKRTKKQKDPKTERDNTRSTK